MRKTNTIKKIFGLNLKELRLSQNLTQEKLAEHLGLETYQTINRIENGKTFVTSELFEKMCIFFNKEPYIFFLKQSQSYTAEDLDQFSKINSKLEKINDTLSVIKNKIK